MLHVDYNKGHCDDIKGIIFVQFNTSEIGETDKICQNINKYHNIT